MVLNSKAQEKLKRKRHNGKVARALNKPRKTTEKGKNVIPAVTDAVKVYSTTTAVDGRNYHLMSLFLPIAEQFFG